MKNFNLSVKKIRKKEEVQDTTGLPLLTINQIIKPIIPAINTTINHSTPLSPLLSASLYTQTAITIAITNHIMTGPRYSIQFCILFYLPVYSLYYLKNLNTSI